MKHTILLVEDNLGDQRLTVEAFRQGPDQPTIKFVNDGMEAMAYLRREGQYSAEPRPSLVILDLNIPKKDGREVLTEMKSDPSLKTIPVIVFTTSKASDDIAQCYREHANCFIAKPVDLDKFFSVIQSVQQFWLGVAELPLA